MALPDYNGQYLAKVRNDEPVINDATSYGVQIQPISNVDAQQYWRVIGVHHLTGAENMGNHHTYVDVLDEQGQRINGSRLILKQDGQSPVFAVVDKPANEAGTNFPMWSSTRASVAVESSLPSETVIGLRTDHADEEIGNTWGHHSFYVVFQRTATSSLEDKTIDSGTESPVTPPGLSLEETIASVGQPLIIPLNPDAGFYKFARQQNLGERLTKEYDTAYQGRNYRAQIYEKGIIYAEVGDWGNIKIIPRTN